MQDLERMGQQATGALDTASMRNGMRDETATGSALAASGFIKRSKRTMLNVEEFMNTLIRRVAHLKMQYEPQRFPNDYDFQVRGTLGIMAREIEQQFLINLAQVLGPEHDASMPIIRAIFEHSGTPVKAQVLKSLKAIEEENKPDEQQQQIMEEAALAQLRIPILAAQKLEAEIFKITEEGELKAAQADKTEEEADQIEDAALVEDLRVLNDLQETRNQSRQLDLLEDKNDIEREKIKLQARNSRND
jgi:hypothetical protein